MENKTLFEEQEILSDMIFEKTNRRVKVKYGELWALGEWFYVEKTFLGNLRLGITFESAKSFVEKILTVESL